MATSSVPDSPAISKSLLDSIVPPPPGWKPPRRFLFGLGPPWEPHPRECSDDEEDEYMIKASQVRSVEFENHPNVEVPNKKMKLSASEDTTKDSIVEVRKNEDEDCR